MSDKERDLIIEIITRCAYAPDFGSCGFRLGCLRTGLLTGEPLEDILDTVKSLEIRIQ